MARTLMILGSSRRVASTSRGIQSSVSMIQKAVSPRALRETRITAILMPCPARTPDTSLTTPGRSYCRMMSALDWAEYSVSKPLIGADDDLSPADRRAGDLLPASVSEGEGHPHRIFMHPAEVGLGEFPRKPRLPRKCEGIRKPLVILAQPERPGHQRAVGAVSAVGFGKGAVQCEAHMGKRSGDDQPRDPARAGPPPPCGSWKDRS